MEEKEKNDLKEVEFYSNSVNAWFSTKLEGTKSILAISAGGLGLLITLLTAFGVNNLTELLIYFGSIFCFLISIIFMISVFFRNAKFLSDMNNGKDENDKILDLMHNIGLWSFVIGIILAFLIGCSILINTIPYNKEDVMQSNDKRKNVKVEKNFNNAQSMKPRRKPDQSTNSQNQSSSTDNTSTSNNTSRDDNK